MKLKADARKISLALAGLFAALTVGIGATQALIVPGSAPGVGSGAISGDAANNVAINNNTPLNTTKFSVYASSTSATHFAIQALQPGGASIFSVRNDGLVTIPGSLTVGSFTSTLTANNVSSGSFGANTGGGNYVFPAQVTVSSTIKAGSGTAMTGSKLVVAVPGYDAISGPGASRVEIGASWDGANTVVNFNQGAGGSGLVGFAPSYLGGYTPRPNIKLDSYATTLYTPFGSGVVISGGGPGFDSPGTNSLTIKGVASMTGDLLRTENSAGTRLFSVISTGGIMFPDGSIQSTASTASSTITASNVSSGAFGANTGNGNYTFPANVAVGTSTISGQLHVVSGAAGNKGVVIRGAASQSGNLFETQTSAGTAMVSTNMDSSGGILNIHGGNGGIGGFFKGDPGGTVSGMHLGVYNMLTLDNIANSGVVAVRTMNANGTVAEGNWQTWSGGTFNVVGYQGYGGQFVLKDLFGGSKAMNGFMDQSQASFGVAFPDGKVIVGDTTPANAASKFHVKTGGAAAIGEIVQGAASQSANLSEWRNSAGTRLFSVSSAGSVMFPDGSIQSTAFTGGGGTVTAGNVSAGAFGANTGGGNYSFPAKLGIGVPSPTYPLEMAATGSNPARASFTSGTGIAGLQLSTNGENWYVDNRGASETPNNRFGIFNNTGAEAFTILQGGNAGVGIPNPLYKLSVGGVIQSTSGGFRFPDGTTQITAATGASTMSAANVSSGSFGANTGGGNYTFPAQLTVSAGLSATGGNFELRDAGVSDSTAVRIFNSAGNLYLQNGSGDHIYFRGKTGGLNMDLTNAGNLGIGVSGPTYRLDVAGDINFTGALRTGGSPGTSGYVLRSNGASAPTWVATSTLGLTGATTITAANISSGSFGANTGGGNYTFPAAVTVTGAANFAGAGIWNASGNVGIGTASPGARLVVEDGTTSDQLRIGDTSGGNYFQIGRNLSTGVLDFNGTQAGYRGYVFANSEQFTVVDDASARIFVATTGANSLAGIRLQARDASSSYDWYLDSRGGMGSPTNKFGIADNGGVERFTILSGGNVGIGVTNPASYKLEVNGVIFSNSGGFRFPDGTTQITAASGGGTVAAANVSSGAFGANTGGGNYTFPGTLGASGVITSSGSNTNIGAHPSYGTSYSAFWRTGSDYAVMTDATNLYVNSPASGGSILFRHANVDAMTLSGTTLTIGGGTGKINVGTVDPVYEINGEKFATYMAGMIGVKEEVAGVFALSCKDNFCSKRIEFASEPKGSDLWLFGKTTDIRKHLPQASVMLTPSFDGRVSYEKGEGVLTIKATTFQPRDTVEVSYRITAPRFDADQWKNTTDDDARGFIIND